MVWTQEACDAAIEACADAKNLDALTFSLRREQAENAVSVWNSRRNRARLDMAIACHLGEGGDRFAAISSLASTLEFLGDEDLTVSIRCLSESSTFRGHIGDFGTAVAELERANQMAESLIDGVTPVVLLPLKLEVVVGLGTLAFNMGDLQKSLQYDREAWLLAVELADGYWSIWSAANLAVSLVSLQEYEESLEWNLRALELSQTHQMEGFECTVLLNLGAVLEVLNRHDESRQVLERGMELVLKRQENHRISHAWFALADLSLALKNVDHAIFCFQNGFEVGGVSRANQPKRKRALAELLVDKSDGGPQALQCLTEAHRIELELSEVDLVTRLSGLSVQRDLDRALREKEYQRAQAKTFQDFANQLETRNHELDQILAQLELKSIELELAARTDVLTQLFNRRFLEACLQDRYAEAKRRGSRFSVAILDIDFFKKVNDHHGHAVGDEVLKLVAGVLKSTARASDIVGRYGGEEFVVVLPGASLEQAARACDRLRRAVERFDWDRVVLGLRVSISVGVAGGTDFTSYEGLLGVADDRLYAAKHAGRNRVVHRDATMEIGPN